MKNSKTMHKTIFPALWLYLCILLAGAGCGEWPDEPTDTGKEKEIAAVIVQYRLYSPRNDVPFSPFTIAFAGHLLEASDGTQGDEDFQTSGKDIENLWPNPQGYAIVSSDGLSSRNLKPGRWQFRVTVNNQLVAICDRKLSAGESKAINFSAGKSGCTEGFGFP